MLTDDKQLMYLSFLMALIDIYLFLPQLDTPRKNVVIMRILIDLAYMTFVYKNDQTTRIVTATVAFPLSIYLINRLFKP